MHEFGIAKNIFDLVCKELEDKEISKVISVELEVGKLTAIVPSALEFCFEILVNGTFMDGARLVINDVPLKMRCEECNNVFEVRDYSYTCPDCNSLKCELVSGDEFLVKKIKVE